ncbi:HupE/UreJ family protein [Marinoscillum sp. MHG1-6]|uniref:HupE/UreJ family protein n=1 Tax=Marinoscillum sp. MHG1-6 TaxID=2959627 RepID=UPI0021571B26|nr:HupE/UreJ family protein [Marinoscillum sp. MHG1-6]
MNEFNFYIIQGIQHITDPAGIDHMLFVITLCAVYELKEWKQTLILVTAFTIGHSLTLALAVLDIVSINQDLVETLIPITILLTSIHNVYQKRALRSRISWNYVLALAFGLIHGLGFSNYLRAMMMGISDSGIIQPLLAFNLGVEFGQGIIVACFMLILFVATKLITVAHREWNLYISGAGGGVALTMIIDSIWL